ncbi:SEC-C domain-containing protein [Clostridiaceae bacterium UIB06]|uniref:SEC-C domain-containing protein n=1 Tax=Clostridium thailandense TaxID=2794346 RepID=A0A949X505_9CLOT|nr:SEC-C domain-containing protein [Clostridium thailandense]MBV7274848.1 SEC-C domain-containing protein [Clostridium thailandense]MCH5137593.1 SEC-C domain-containing protein [Clostridiaceae bacterium UIB06]
MKENLYSSEKKIKLLPNQQCICGSGLRYKECCLNKNFQYKTLGKNYENREIIFNYTKTNELYNHISNFLLKEILNKELSVSKGKEYIKYLYKIGEEGTRPFLNYASCQKGCSNCCHIYMDCTVIEADLIREYLLKNFSEEEIFNLNNKIKETINELPTYKDLLKNNNVNDSIKSFSDKRIPCIFLSSDNTCSIYEVRPFNCRRLINFSSTSACNRGEDIIRPNISVDNITFYAINHLAMNITRYKKLKTYSEAEGEDRAIYKSIQHWFKDGFNDIDRSL